MAILTKADFEGPQDYLGTSSRRVFVKGLGFVGVSLLLSTLGGCDKWLEQIKNRPVRRRLRTGSAEVDADIATYRQAVELIKALPSADQRNWVAEATIHGTPAAFNMCEHGTVHFFDWHRAYLFYFEKICQKLTGNAQFGLPYWNWNLNPAIPGEFLDSTSALFSTRSRTTMGTHSAVSTATLDTIFSDTNFFSFGSQIEGSPHNSVHSYIDGTLGQGDSPRDPLFWNHHCMIDYCWYKWNIEMGRDNTNDSAWMNHPNGDFIDGDGNPATATALATVLMPLLSYRYESSAIGSNPAKAEPKAKKEFKAIEDRVRAGANIRFVVKQRTRLSERASVSSAKPLQLRAPFAARNFSAVLEKRSAPERIFVAVEQAQVSRPLDVYVRVFVNLPNANAGTPDSDPHFAGSFAFFGDPAKHGRHGATRGPVPRFMVDVTRTLENLRKQGGLADDAPITVQLVPTPFDAQPRTTAAAPAEVVLGGVDILTTPVIVETRPPQ